MRLLDELLKTLGELRASSVFFCRLYGFIRAFSTSSAHDALDGRKVIIKSLKLVLHLLKVAVAQSFPLLCSHADSFECLHFFALQSVLEARCFTLLGDSSHKDLFGRVCHFTLELFDEAGLADSLALIFGLQAILAIFCILVGHCIELGSLVDSIISNKSAPIALFLPISLLAFFFAIDTLIVFVFATPAHVIFNIGLALFIIII